MAGLKAMPYFVEGLIVAARRRVRRLISSALRLLISREKEWEIVGKSLSLRPINAIEGAKKETATRATTSPAADFQSMQVTETQEYFFVHRRRVPLDIQKFAARDASPVNILLNS